MRSVAVVFLLLASPLAWAETPRPGSPAALRQYPRLLVTHANRPALRAQIKANYSVEFQRFLDLLGTGIEKEADRTDEKTIENTWGPINYAFPVALGVDELKALGFRFPTAYDTPGKLCSRAYQYLTTDTTDGASGKCTASAPCKSQLFHLTNYAQCGRASGQACDTSMRGTSESITTYTAPSPFAFYLTPVLAFDWCHDQLSAAQRQTIAEAFWEHYQQKWVDGLGTGKTLLTTENSGNDITHGGRWYQFADDLLFAVSAWGDTSVLDEGRRRTLYEAFEKTWLDRFVFDTNKLYGRGWNYYAGASYWTYGQLNALPPMAAIDLALGTSYTEAPWFSQQGRGIAAWFWPEYTGKETGCGADGKSACPTYAESWGYNTSTIGPVNHCRAMIMAVGFARLMAQSTGKAEYADDAALARWAFDKFGAHANRCAADTRKASTIVNSQWANAVWRWFLFGAEGVAPRQPTEKNLPLGFDYYLFRDDYTEDDSSVFFGAATLRGGGHDSKDFGHFTLHKFGPLITKGGNQRSGSCVVPIASGRLLYQNNIGIHTGANDVSLSADGSLVPDPDWAARGLPGMFSVAARPPKHSFGSGYSYVHYDQGPLWKQATKMQREFTYLRGSTNHEYLVILDRVDVTNTADDPIWKAYVTAPAQCVDAACANPRAGKWTTKGRIVSVTNEDGPLASGSLPATHGKLFLKALLPVDARIQMLGDDGSGKLSVQSGNDDGTSMVTSACTPEHYDIYGWGRIEVRPGTVARTNVFLNVIQFGDSRTLARMAPADVVESDDRNFLVARVADSERNRVVVFAKDAATSASDGGFRYTYAPTTAQSDHMIANLAPSTTYHVSTSGVSPITVEISKSGGGMVRQTDAAGVLDFQVAGAAVVATPRAPRNVRVP